MVGYHSVAERRLQFDGFSTIIRLAVATALLVLAAPLTLPAQPVAWWVYLDAHARRVYESVTAGPKVAAARLAAEIQAGRLIGPFQARQVYRKGWSGLTEREDVDAAFDVLEDLHWLRSIEVPPTVKGGRCSFCEDRCLESRRG